MTRNNNETFKVMDDAYQPKKNIYRARLVVRAEKFQSRIPTSFLGSWWLNVITEVFGIY